MQTLIKSGFVVAVLSMCPLAGATVVKTIDFESMPLGALPGGPDGRIAGGDQWWVPDNAATFGEVRDGVGRSGSRGLVVGNRGNGNDGVIDNVKSPRLSASAGEPGTNSGTNGTTASYNIFTSSYWFRTAAEEATDGFSFKSETYGPDRTTYIGFFYQTAVGDTSLTAWAADIRDVGNGDYDFEWTFIADNLAWGQWYRVETEIIFHPGPDNDVVNHRLYDENNVLVGSALGLKSWEEGARQFGYNGGEVFAVDAVQFQARGHTPAGDAVYIDDLIYSVVPEPASLSLLALGGLGLLRRRRV